MGVSIRFKKLETFVSSLFLFSPVLLKQIVMTSQKRKKRKKVKVDELKKIVKEAFIEERFELFFEKNVPTNPSKWSYYKSQAKKKFDVYPSAYANAWAAKWYKSKGGKWKGADNRVKKRKS